MYIKVCAPRVHVNFQRNVGKRDRAIFLSHLRPGKCCFFGVEGG